MITVTKDVVQQSVRKDPIIQRQGSDTSIDIQPNNIKHKRKPNKRYTNESHSNITMNSYDDDSMSDNTDGESSSNNNNNNYNNNNIRNKHKYKSKLNQYSKPLPKRPPNPSNNNGTNKTNKRNSTNNAYGKGKNFKINLKNKNAKKKKTRIIQQSNQKNIDAIKNSAKIEDFSKVKILPNAIVAPKKSGLAKLFDKHGIKPKINNNNNDGNINNGNHSYNNSESNAVTNNDMTVYFGEYLDNPIHVNYTDFDLIRNLIKKSIQVFNYQNNNLKLKTENYKNYECKFVDIDEYDDEVEIDDDMEPIKYDKNVKSLNIINIGICLSKNFVNSGQYNDINSVNFEEKVAYNGSNNNEDNKQNRRATLEDIVKKKNLLLVRIIIPGPNDEKHVFSIEREQTAITFRDLFSLINKKKNESQFTPAYFDFYYENEPGLLILCDIL